MIKLLKNKGFTLIELLAVLIILGILITAVSIGVSSSMHNGRVSSTTSSLQLFSSDMEIVLAEYGVFVIDQAEDKRMQTLEFISMLEQYYMHTYFDKESLVVYANYFEIATSTQLDGWDSPFLLRYNYAASTAGTCMFISAGANMHFDNSYANGDFGDDLILIVSPKKN